MYAKIKFDLPTIEIVARYALTNLHQTPYLAAHYLEERPKCLRFPYV
jgi:hypothetical protein